MPIKCVLEGTTNISCSERLDCARNQQMDTAPVELLESDNILENKLNGWETIITLTKREREILRFVLEGKTNKEIAQELYRTERTVEYHRNRMMRKLGTHNIVELVKRAIALGIA